MLLSDLVEFLVGTGKHFVHAVEVFFEGQLDVAGDEVFVDDQLFDEVGLHELRHLRS